MDALESPLPASQIQGCILGAALGDALGLPAEGMSRQRIQRFWPGPLRHRLLFGKGMGSDDTEHLFLTAQAWLEARGDLAAFQTALGRKLRWWLVAMPAGAGLATARALTKLWLGWKPGSSGVFSAGNGPAMRSGILGAILARDPVRMIDAVRISTRLTHTDPKALTGALAVAHAAAAASLGNAAPSTLIAVWKTLSTDQEWQDVISAIQRELIAGTAVLDFADLIGCRRGVSGYIYKSVPVALYAWLRHQGDFRAIITESIRCGGDTDTVASIAGAIAGLEAGMGSLPSDWLKGLGEWPRSRRILMRLGDELACGQTGKPVNYSVAGLIPRNVLFLGIVLAHGFRRLLPPY